MLSTGELQVFGHLSLIEKREEGFCVEVEKSKKIYSKYLINGTGPGYNPSTIPFLDLMLQRSMISKHAHGGIEIHPETHQVMGNNGQLQSHLYAVGEITKGASFFTTDFGCVTAQADKVTSHLITTLRAYPKKGSPLQEQHVH
tara:strand:- start:533 stop:961 length:429 start_codon:yes stop_codon:yes gene_type:complete